MALLSGLLKAGGAGFQGYGQDKQRMAAEVVQAALMERQRKQDAALAVVQARAAARPDLVASLYGKARGGDVAAQGQLIGEDAAKYGDFDQAPVKPVTPPRVQIVDGQRVDLDTGIATPIEGYKAPPKEAKAPNLITAPDPSDPGKLIRVADVAGQEVPGPSAGSGMGGAAIKKALAANTSQLAIIDDAMKELEASPGATGLIRGLPFVGDRLDPRADPKGVAARAQIANIGSLKIHDRSGAAVSVAEFPRLAPFIPAVSDPPAAIKIKLKKLREAVQIEMDALRQQGGGAPATSGGGSAKTPGLGSREAAIAHLKAQGKTDAQILATLGPP